MPLCRRFSSSKGIAIPLTATQHLWRQFNGKTRKPSNGSNRKSPKLAAKEPHRLLISRQTGQVRSSTHMDGNRVNRDLGPYLEEYFVPVHLKFSCVVLSDHVFWMS